MMTTTMAMMRWRRRRHWLLAVTVAVILTAASSLPPVCADEDKVTLTSTAALRADALAWLKSTHPPKQHNRKKDPLADELSSRARLFFRAMDADHDNFVGADDVLSNAAELKNHAPGMSASAFRSFIELADQNHDGKLDQTEFGEGLAKSIENAAFVETDASMGRRGFLSSVGKFVGSVGSKLAQKAKALLAKATGKVDKKEDGCVICQYVVERCETNVKASGVIPSITGATMGPSIFLEMESRAAATTSAAQTPFDMAASSIIGATRQSTRYQRQLERQKYNEIYRVVDITLDDTCEQSMPNEFYNYCMAMYQMQSDLVDGLRYQYRPADICFRIGLCGKGSYITKGIHSRYKT